MKQIVILVSVAALSGCGDGSSSYESGAYQGSSGFYEDSFETSEERQSFDEDAAREAAEEELAREGYDYSYGCTDDCSGHEVTAPHLGVRSHD